MDISFEELVEAAQKLSPAKKAALLRRLTSNNNAPNVLTRESVIEQLKTLREAGAFSKVESLRGVYARSDLHIDQDELASYLLEVGKEWEQDVDDLFNTN